MLLQMEKRKRSNVNSGNATDDETKGTLSGNSLYSLLGAAGVHDERSTFHKDFKIRGFIGEKGEKRQTFVHKSVKANRRRTR